jgi:hypothetical protein
MSVRPNRRRLQRSADPIRHLQTREGLAKAWAKLARDLYTPRICKDMPTFVEKLAKAFWTVDPSAVVSAITNGDPAFFISFQLRLDQIDCALVKAGRGIADRAPVIRAKYVIDGFRLAATDVLAENGGDWPPREPKVEQDAA